MSQECVIMSVCYSVRLGVFLRRYPVARVFVIVYMVSCNDCSVGDFVA